MTQQPPFPRDILDETMAVDRLQVVSDETPATPEQILELRSLTNWHVNQFTMAGPPGDELPTENVDWYNLLHATQGNPGLILACGYIEDASGFALDSLFCEWAYLIDLDRDVFEVYEGFQTELPTAGHWAGRPTAEEDEAAYQRHLAWCQENDREPFMGEVSEYKAVQLVGAWPFDALPTDKEFLALEQQEEEVTA